jgi:hypothetical protein
MLQVFINFLEEKAKSNTAYVWGGQGHKGLTDSQINRMETSAANAKRVMAFRNVLLSRGIPASDIEYFDCSGLGVYPLLNILQLISYDTTADGLMGFCERIKRANLKRGDWVFRVYTSGSKKGQAYHIGYVVDDGLNVIEAKGRDDGVVKRPLSASGAHYWNAYGRPRFFKEEIERSETPSTWRVSRVLKLLSPMQQGNDVRDLQAALTNLGFACGKLDGVFGLKTDAAVRAYQASRDLVVDGKAGRNTITSLGGIWTDAS